MTTLKEYNEGKMTKNELKETLLIAYNKTVEHFSNKDCRHTCDFCEKLINEINDTKMKTILCPTCNGNGEIMAEIISTPNRKEVDL